MWIDDDGTVSSFHVSGAFRLLRWRARWSLWTAEPEEFDDLVDDVTALETAAHNAASCRREWPAQSVYREREIPRELLRELHELRDFADVREHLLAFPLSLSMQWQTDAVQVAVSIVDTVRLSRIRRRVARSVHRAASLLRTSGIGGRASTVPRRRRIAPLDACNAPGELVDEFGDPLLDPSRADRVAAARSRALR